MMLYVCVGLYIYMYDIIVCVRVCIYMYDVICMCNFVYVYVCDIK